MREIHGNKQFFFYFIHSVLPYLLPFVSLFHLHTNLFSCSFFLSLFTPTLFFLFALPFFLLSVHFLVSIPTFFLFLPQNVELFFYGGTTALERSTRNWALNNVKLCFLNSSPASWINKLADVEKGKRNQTHLSVTTLFINRRFCCFIMFSPKTSWWSSVEEAERATLCSVFI